MENNAGGEYVFVGRFAEKRLRFSVFCAILIIHSKRIGKRRREK